MTMPASGATVLLVERGDACRDTVGALLAAEGLHVLAARSAEEAAAALRAGDVAVAVVDGSGIDGTALTARMRGAGGTAAIVLLVGTAEASGAAEASAAGPDRAADDDVETLAKPVDATRLFGAIRAGLARQRQAHEVAETRRRARELDELSAMFVAVLGHDLRGPLQSVELGAQVVLGRLDDRDTVERMALTVQRASRRMAEMIDQLVCFARVRLQGAVAVLPVACDAAELVRTAVADLDRPAADRVALETAGDTQVTWDRDRMGQVVTNLLRNAVRHGAPGRPIAVAVGGDRDRVALTVRNDGHMAPEILPTLLDPSARASRSCGASTGLGLGLYIVDRIVAAHGGTLWIDSSPAAGTEVRIELPRHAAART